MFPIKDTIPHKTPPYINVSLIFINAVLFFYELSLSSLHLERFIYHYGVVPILYTHWELSAQMGVDNLLSRLFTSMFLHGGWTHFIGNMWFLWIFGDNVEDFFGHFRYLLFYLLSGLLAAFFHILLNPSSTIPTIGASGAIAGVMGAYFLLYPTSRIVTVIFFVIIWDIIEIPAYFFLGLWFLMQLFSAVGSVGYEGGGIAFWAHVGGFVAGYWLTKRRLNYLIKTRSKDIWRYL